MQRSRIHRRLPPYGRQVMERIAAGGDQGRSVWVAAGSGAWQWAATHPHHMAVVAPIDAAPSTLCWEVAVPEDRRNPALIHVVGVLKSAALDELAAELLLAGAMRVIVTWPDGRMVRYLPEQEAVA